MPVEIAVREDAHAAARAAAERLAAAARAGGHIALSRGSTPRRAYELAAQLEPDWSRVELWWADERCVAPYDPRSNYRLVRETLLDGLARTPRVVHRVKAELGPDEAARLYDDDLRGASLDLALLGVGPDGHTASLFPRAPALDERERHVTAAEAQPQPFVDRITMTIPPLSAAGTVLFLITGAEKADAARNTLDEAPSPATPASLVRGRATVAVLDRAAAAALAG